MPDPHAKYGFIGHGTQLYAAGEPADAFYVHEVTTIHDDGEDWETIAFIPTGVNDAGAALETAHVLGAAYDMRDILQEALAAWPEFDDGDAPVNGGDMVDWFAGFRERIALVLAKSRGEPNAASGQQKG